MTIETYVRAQLARIALEEGARYGGVNNMLAIAMVLRNRVFAGWGTWVDVIMDAQRRPTNDNVPSFDPAPVLKSPTGRILLSEIDQIYSRPEVEDLTGGALFWVNPSFPIAPWFRGEVLERPADHKRVAHIGPVWFFQ